MEWPVDKLKRLVRGERAICQWSLQDCLDCPFNSIVDDTCYFYNLTPTERRMTALLELYMRSEDEDFEIEIVKPVVLPESWGELQ